MRAAWWLRLAPIAGVVLGAPGLAAAFSDHTLFGAGVDKGGGDGRYFTGSRADGHACSVCHHGGPAPTILVDGIPDLPVAGQRYSIVIHWPDPETPHALQLELTTRSGTQPTVSILPDANLPAESRCDHVASGLPAVYLVDAGVRRIVGVEDCHAQSVTVSFVGTGEPIDLAIAAVASNEMGDTAGDGTFELRTTMGGPREGQGGVCSASSASGGSAGLLIGLAALTATRRRRAR